MGINGKFKVGQKNHGTAGGNLVCQKNDLIRASYHLRLDEFRLVLIAMSKVDARGFDEGGMEWHGGEAITITTREWREVLGISQKNAFAQLARAARGLSDREITKISGAARTELRWIWQKSDIFVGEGKVILYFSQGLLQYLQNLEGGFTKFRLAQIASLRSVYAIRIFQLCIQFRATGKAKLALARFHETLCTPRSARTRLSEFKRSVLAPAVTELKTGCIELADLEWEIIDGRLVEFSFPPHSLPRLPRLPTRPETTHHK